MLLLWTIPFLLQAPLIIFDEWVFHVKRGLPKWERWGHPLDTFTVVLALSLPAFFSYSPPLFKTYIALAIFSCLMVTKDEWVHKHHCPPAEHWVHALLFLNHPVLMTAGGFLWVSELPWAATFLKSQVFFAITFMLYQAIYWNFYGKRVEDQQ